MGFVTCTESLEEAQEMILKAQAWRHEAKVDSIMEEWGQLGKDGWQLEPKSPRARAAAELFAAERLPDDALGGPVMLGRFSSVDMPGISRENLAELLQNQWVFMLEDMLHSAHVASVKKQRLVRGSTIIDASGLRLSVIQYIAEYKPWLDIMNNDYPDLVRSVVVLNAPAVFVQIWKVLSVLISPLTREKVRIVGSDYTQLLQEQGLDLDSLPVFLGGKYEGSRLNSKLTVPKGAARGLNVSFGGL
ncbi:unnamed protein product [Effrenium voratum]|uniref:CRAL-TRIO domain-containing protein n=1 Tax=Effrenium voratum TaxID=2562239 RepID=A0AA36IJQ0_9DINO|nr:unnamed protein product [Effrenium voratum]